MALPTIYPTRYAGTAKVFLKVKADRSGAARICAGAVTSSSGTATDTYVGLFPFNKGARVIIGDKSVYVGDIGTTATTVNLGYLYETSTSSDADAWVSLSTASGSGGYLTVDEIQGLSFVAADNGWVTLQIAGAATNAAGDVTFQAIEAYDGLGVNNSNNQS